MGRAEELDQNGQPLNLNFCRAQNTEKAFEGLYGVLKGISSDKQISDGEILFLDAWLRDQAYLRKDPDVIDLLDAIQDILADGVVTKAERKDLLQLVKDILEFRDEFVYFDDNVKTQLNIAMGIFSGISSDVTLTDGEIKFLKRWLKETEVLQDHWPVSTVFKVVKDALKDGVITEQERAEILQILEDVVGGSIQEDGVASGKSSRLPLHDIDRIEFEGRVFCFTGTMTYGPRAMCEELTIAKGGTVIRGVTKKLDYLVLGPIASRDWIHSSFGRKVEKAMQYGKTIISEEVWKRSL